METSFDDVKRAANEATQSPPPETFREGKLAKAIENQTAKLPSDIFLWAAGGAMVLSLISQLQQPRRRRFFNVPSRSGQLSLFFGQWVPTLMLFGVYNKIVKTRGGSDAVSAREGRTGSSGN